MVLRSPWFPSQLLTAFSYFLLPNSTQILSVLCALGIFPKPLAFLCTFALVTSSNPMVLKDAQTLMTTKAVSPALIQPPLKFQTHILHCPLDNSIRMSNRISNLTNLK